MKEKATQPQISPARFQSILELDEIDKGRKIYKMLDQTKSHWQFECYWIKGQAQGGGLIAFDEDGKLHILKCSSKLYIYKGHA